MPVSEPRTPQEDNAVAPRPALSLGRIAAGVSIAAIVSLAIYLQDVIVAAIIVGVVVVTLLSFHAGRGDRDAPAPPR